MNCGMPDGCEHSMVVSFTALETVMVGRFGRNLRPGSIGEAHVGSDAS